MPNMNKEFICDKCGKIFKSGPSLRAHKSSHSEKVFNCKICGEEILGAAKYKMHIGNHKIKEKDMMNKNKFFQCKLCWKTFDSQHALDGHKSAHIKKQTYHCQHCDDMFNKKEYVSHINEVLSNNCKDFYLNIDDKYENELFVKCKLCEHKVLDLKSHVEDYHNINFDVYLNLFKNSNPTLQAINNRAKFELLPKIKDNKKINMLKVRGIMNHPESEVFSLCPDNVLFSDSIFYVISEFNNKTKTKNPDFIIVNQNDLEKVKLEIKNSKSIIDENLYANVKKVIEVFGDYWHSEKITGYPNNIHEEHTIDFYKKAGIDCLIIWEHETKNKSQLKIKIDEFLNS